MPRTATSDSAPIGADLTALIETEVRLERALVAAREAAAARLEQARGQAESIEAGIDAELAEARARIDREITAERARRVDAAVADAAARVRAYAAIEGAALTALARELAARLVDRVLREDAP